MNPYLDFGPGSEPVAWVALLLGLAALVVSLRWGCALELQPRARRLALLAMALTAALLSAGYIAHYLRGGPRIVDASHYYLQARALAAGAFSFEVPTPHASFNGRFLVTAPDGSLGVLFPPGYPAALALAFELGAPLALGPCLAALLVVTTYSAGRALGATAQVALGAALLSMLSAALRYHTADTMSHGLAALLVTTTIIAAARGSVPMLFLAGLSAGWLIATRPVTGMATLLPVAWLARGVGLRALWAVPGLAPGIALLLLHQRALTGDALASTQLAYYAAADGPPGCFRYGFGSGIGCLFEHGEFVRARLPQGYGLGEALANTWRRLGVHTLDIANAAPLAPFALYGAWIERADRRFTAAFALVIGVIVAYAPFYFEGSYPGGGARFFADVVPVEHVLIARGLAAAGLLRFAVPASLLGFALHTGQQHALLRDREGGRPMFEPGVLRAAGVTHGLVFVGTDHGFALGHEPGARNGRTGIVIARRRGDGLDRLLWEALGRPAAYSYAYDSRPGGKPPSVARLAPSLWTSDRIEFENLWPPRSMANGWGHPDFSSRPCVSGARGLRLEPTGRPIRIRFQSPYVDWPATIRIAVGSSAAPRLKLAQNNDAEPLVWRPTGDGCWLSSPVGPPTQNPTFDLLVEDEILLDYIVPGPRLADKGVDN